MAKAKITTETQQENTSKHVLVVQDEIGVANTSETQYLQVVEFTDGQLPDLDQATEIPIDLMADYWTPEQPGEAKRVYFDCIKERLVRDQQDPNVTFMLPCAFFFEKETGKPARTISNGSKRLVGLMENLSIQRGTPLLITYMGKKKNATNQNSSDRWSVNPLLLKIK